MNSAPTLREMLHGLIAAPSVSSVHPQFDQGNRQVAELFAGWLEGAGFRTRLIPIPGMPAKFNVVGVLGGARGAGRDGLVLAGHTDTVPFDANGWSSDPFCLSERDGRLYGLGTSDMKSFLALALEAAREFDGNRLTRPLTIVGTADEESSMCGARALDAEMLAHPRHGVIGEPTALRPVHMHKGIMMEAVRLTGRGGHSSDPALGASALDAMTRVLGELTAWRAELGETFRDARFPVPVPTLNLGHIHGGDNPNRICAHCELHLDLRPLPGMDAAELRGELARRVARAVADTGVTARVESLFSGIDPLHTPATAPVVKAAEALTGRTAEAVTFGTEGPFLAALGVETVILGPGNLSEAHRPDEFLETARIPPTLSLLKGMIGRFCAGEG
ncbi:MAG: acetylornithine deacetylase [Nitrospirota bacterium]|nr:acetylornithine deacetylase [Nitrospirota bacterium]